MLAGPPTPNAGDQPRRHRRARPPGRLLARLRVRKKLLVLHTVFSVLVTLALFLVLRPIVRDFAVEGERSRLEAILLAEAVAPGSASRAGFRGVELVRIPASGVRTDEFEILQGRPLQPVGAGQTDAEIGVMMLAPAVGGTAESYLVARARLDSVRATIARFDLFLLLAMFLAYAVVAVVLEFVVLPRHVYGPVRRMLDADRALQQGDRAEELINEALAPSDELGEIMRSRNRSVRALRENERQLASALGELERVAADLKRKNHLLERARQNLADADRLASLGMMSAGIAHELNTPLAVVRGLVDKIRDSHAKARSGRTAPGPGLSDSEAELLVRVTGRLERLSESLLDFARVRQPSKAAVPLSSLVDEAMTLVRLDREAAGVALRNRVDDRVEVWGDADRLLQVLVNLVRNAADALATAPRRGAEVRVSARIRDAEDGEQSWVAIVIEDNGPGIPNEMLPRLFEPFVSSRLDHRGTGLGLAVSEGIVQEHGGMIVAGNKPGGGAAFEVLLPPPPAAQQDPGGAGSDTGAGAGEARPAAEPSARVANAGVADGSSTAEPTGEDRP